VTLPAYIYPTMVIDSAAMTLRYVSNTRRDGGPTYRGVAADLDTAREWVAALVAADIEYDAARLAYDAAFIKATHTRTAKSPNHGDPVVLRYRQAMINRSDILSRFRS
jgi:hypothetical protein